MIAENIASKYQHLEPYVGRKAIMAHFLKNDESHLWPILDSFNATQRAIDILCHREIQRGEMLFGLELALELDQTISEIVNQTV